MIYPCFQCPYRKAKNWTPQEMVKSPGYRLIKAARKIRALKEKQECQTKTLRDLAAEAQRTRKSLTHRIDNSVMVVDFSTAIDELCDALNQI
jgi:hypothetical protein